MFQQLYGNDIQEEKQLKLISLISLFKKSLNFFNNIYGPFSVIRKEVIYIIQSKKQINKIVQQVLLSMHPEQSAMVDQQKYKQMIDTDQTCNKYVLTTSRQLILEDPNLEQLYKENSISQLENIFKQYKYSKAQKKIRIYPALNDTYVFMYKFRGQWIIKHIDESGKILLCSSHKFHQLKMISDHQLLMIAAQNVNNTPVTNIKTWNLRTNKYSHFRHTNERESAVQVHMFPQSNMICIQQKISSRRKAFTYYKCPLNQYTQYINSHTVQFIGGNELRTFKADDKSLLVIVHSLTHQSNARQVSEMKFTFCTENYLVQYDCPLTPSRIHIYYPENILSLNESKLYIKCKIRLSTNKTDTNHPNFPIKIDNNYTYFQFCWDYVNNYCHLGSSLNNGSHTYFIHYLKLQKYQHFPQLTALNPQNLLPIQLTLENWKDLESQKSQKKFQLYDYDRADYDAEINFRWRIQLNRNNVKIEIKTFRVKWYIKNQDIALLLHDLIPNIDEDLVRESLRILPLGVV